MYPPSTQSPKKFYDCNIHNHVLLKPYHTLCRWSILQPEWFLSVTVLNQLMWHTDVSSVVFISQYRVGIRFQYDVNCLICFDVIKLWFSLLNDLSTFHYKIHNYYWDFVSILFKIHFADCCENKLLVDIQNSWQCLCDNYPRNALNNLYM